MLHKLVGTQRQRDELRVNMLLSTDWYSIRHKEQLDAKIKLSLTPEQYSELLAYRQALREWPLSGDYNEALPPPPPWLTI